MVATGPKLCASLICFLLASGCFSMELKPPPDAIAILDVAIAAVDSTDAKCAASEFSTDDQPVHAVLRERDFAIVSYEARTSDEEIEHQFTLRQKGSKMLLSADVVVVRGECSTYTFARIAQSE